MCVLFSHKWFSKLCLFCYFDLLSNALLFVNVLVNLERCLVTKEGYICLYTFPFVKFPCEYMIYIDVHKYTDTDVALIHTIQLNVHVWYVYDYKYPCIHGMCMSINTVSVSTQRRVLL